MFEINFQILKTSHFFSGFRTVISCGEIYLASIAGGFPIFSFEKLTGNGPERYFKTSPLLSSSTTSNNREYAVGAVSSKGFSFDPVISGVPQQYLVEEVSRLQKLVKEKETAYHKEFEAQNIKKRWVILVDDGLATGNTITAAANLLAQKNPAGIIVALPVGPEESIRKLNGNPVINEVICVETPEYFEGVGQFYQYFNPVEDSEAIALLKNAETYQK